MVRAHKLVYPQRPEVYSHMHVQSPRKKLLASQQAAHCSQETDKRSAAFSDNSQQDGNNVKDGCKQARVSRNCFLRWKLRDHFTSVCLNLSLFRFVTSLSQVSLAKCSFSSQKQTSRELQQSFSNLIKSVNKK